MSNPALYPSHCHPSFGHGTLIQGEQKALPIERLTVGCKILVENGDYQAIRWIGRKAFDENALVANPDLRPVRIMAGALGNGLPKRDLLVSRQHRMLVQSKIAERMLAESQVLIPANQLIELPGVFIDEGVNSVEYFHLLFDSHAVIYAEGAPSESLCTGPEALKAISPEAREEVLTIFPEVAKLDYTPKPARFIPPSKLQKKLIARPIKNNQPLFRPVAH